MVGEDIGRLRETLTRLRGSMDVPGSTAPWEAESLRRRADAIGHLAGPDARATAAADIARAKAEAAELADLLDVTVHRQQIATYGEKVITNAASLPGIIGGIDTAVRELRRLGKLTPEDDAAAQAGKARACRYRSERLLEQAEIATAGGRMQTAERLRREAGAVLKIDMRRAFPNGEP